MSSINDLFGTPSSGQLESTVSELFKKSSGPVDALKVKAKVRTVLPAVTESAVEPQIEESVEVEESSSGEETTVKRKSETAGVEEEEISVVKKQKKAAKKGENDDLEERYYSKLLKDQEPEKEEQEKSQDAAETKEIEKPVVANSSVAKKQDFKEEELEKADKTVFVGNVPTDVITSKKAYKEFKLLFSTVVATQSETSGDEESTDNTKADLLAIASIRFRSISFDEALPRKVAFMQQKLHKARDSVNAYVVYKNKAAVNFVCKNLNGTVFYDHHLRTDSVAHPTKHDNKRSVFVGNLDFEEAEENLWKNFSSCGDIEYVRIVRDSKTNMGKGFAYVQFKDFQSVNKALLLDGRKINGTGRKLRVTRCKNMAKQQSKQASLSKKLTDTQRTKLGRAKKVLGKADRSTAGKQITIEGMRATKGDTTPGLKRKKQRSKTGRVTKRSTAFKKAAKEKSK
ncbi:LAFE_0D10704g1_1 [Lachancea fermentati]|uniref:Nucleolar protein 12 n=1 Tax=Lachancea fermentati TaxID=4955 RepID=A0A1G4MC20_LACFM|nr:LAFE_0D10704g1_1 [Lachancea fermentati]